MREQVSRVLSPIPFLMAHHGSQLLNRAIEGTPLSKEVFEGNMRHVFEKHMALAGGVNNHQTISQKLAQPLIQADINVLKKQGIKLKGISLGSRVDENINGDISLISQTNDLAYPLFSDDRAKTKSFLPQGLGENTNFVILQPTLRLIHHWSQELKTNRVMPQWAHGGATAENGEGLRLKGSRYNLERVINLSGHGIVRAILEAQFKTNVPGVFRLQIYDGKTAKVSDFHTGNGASQLLAVDFPVSDTATQLTLRAIQAGASTNPNAFVDISRISFALLDRVSLLDFPTDNIQVSRIGNMLKLHGGHFNFSAEIPLSGFLGNSVEVRTQMLSHTPNLYGMQLYDGQVSTRSALRHSGSGEFELISASYNKREGVQKLEIRAVQANDEVFDPLYRSIAPTMGVHINQNLQLMHKLAQDFQTNLSLKGWSQQLYAEEFDKKFIEDTLLPHLRNYTNVVSYKNYQAFMSDKGTGYKVGMNLNSYMDSWKSWNNGAIKVFPNYTPPQPLITRTGEGIQLKGSLYNFQRVLDISNRKATSVTLESIFKTNVPNMFGVQIWDGYTSTDRSKNRHTGDGTFQVIRETHLIDPRATHLYLRAIQANASSDPNVVVDLKSAIYSLTEHQDLRQWDKTGLLAENRGGGVAIVGHHYNFAKIFKREQLFGNEITIKGTVKTNIPQMYGFQLWDGKQGNRSDKHSGSGRVEELTCSSELHPEATELTVRAIQANTKTDGNIYDPYYRDLGKAIVSMVSHPKVLDEILAKTIEGKADLNYLRRLLLSQGIQIVSDDPAFLTTLGYAARHMVENALLGDFKFGQFLKTMVAEWSKPQILSTPIREAVVKTLETPVEEATPKAMIFPEEQGKAKILITYPEEETGMQILTWEVPEEVLKKIPDSLKKEPALRGEGIQWNSEDKRLHIRIMKAKPNADFDCQKVDYVSLKKDGLQILNDGSQVKGRVRGIDVHMLEEAHIALSEWLQWKTPWHP